MSEETDPTPADNVAGPDDLSPEQAAELEAAMADARERLLSVPPEVVVVNHVMGLYELAAIHLSNTPPSLGAATLAIDSMALLVDGLGERLGADAATMRDALSNIRMAFVAVSSSAGSSTSEADASADTEGGDAGDAGDNSSSDDA